MSKSLITRQQREAVLSGSYHFHKIRLCVLVGSGVCALFNFAVGRDPCEVFDLNAENCNPKVTVNDIETMLALLLSVIFRVFSFLFLVAQLFLYFFFLFLFFFFLLPEVF